MPTTSAIFHPTTLPSRAYNFIGGRPCPALDEQWLGCTCDGDFHTTPDSNEDDVDDAVLAARATLPIWAQLDFRQRQMTIKNAATALTMRRSKLLEAELLEMKLSDDRTFDHSAANDKLCSVASSHENQIVKAIGTLLTANTNTWCAPQPDGALHYLDNCPPETTKYLVASHLSLDKVLQRMAVLLLSGRTVVTGILQSEREPTSIHLSLALEILSSQLPAGVLNIINGRANPMGLALSNHPGAKHTPLIPLSECRPDLSHNVPDKFGNSPLF